MMIHFKFHQNKNVPNCRVYYSDISYKREQSHPLPINYFWWSQTTPIYYLVFYKNTK